MSGFDQWLDPLSEDQPCGEDLEYDADFMALERDAAPKEAQVMGDSVVEAEEPDWRAVREQARALMERHRDIRTTRHLARAELHLSGLLKALEIFDYQHQALEKFWDHIHPQLDADDDNDPTERINATASWADPQTMLDALRRAPFVSSKMAGAFGLRQLRIAKGEITPADDESSVSLALIEGAISELDADEFADVQQAIDRAVAAVGGIEALFRDKCNGDAPDLDPLLEDLREIQEFLLHAGPSSSAMPADSEAGATSGGGGSGTAQAQAVNSPAGAIQSREDAARRIQDICVWFERNEPSSPVPLLLRRARNLIGKNFMDLVQDVAASGYSEISTLAKVDAAQDTHSVSNSNDSSNDAESADDGW